MPRAVKTWSWRRLLRDYGPDHPRLRLTLFTLSTFANEDGIAFPSQSTLATGALASVRTIRRHVAQAIELDWLAVEVRRGTGQGWRKHVYRLCVPDDMPLTETDRKLSDAVISVFGELPDPEGGDTMLAARSPQDADTIVSSRSLNGRGGATETCGQPQQQRADKPNEGAAKSTKTCGHTDGPLSRQEVAIRIGHHDEGAELPLSTDALSISEDIRRRICRLALEGWPATNIVRKFRHRRIPARQIRQLVNGAAGRRIKS